MISKYGPAEEAASCRAVILFIEREEKMDAKHIFFDLDGTLIKSEQGICKSFQVALAHFGIREDEENLKKMIGPPLHESFRKHYNLIGARYEEALEIFRGYYIEKGVYECELYPGIRRLLSKLCGEGKRLYLATSKPEPQAVQILEHFNLEGRFSFIGGADGDRDTSRSTKAAVISYVMKEAGLKERDRILMVGDRSYDIKGAKENKIASAGVLYGYGKRAELEQAGADLICETVSELEQSILGMRNDRG